MADINLTYSLNPDQWVQGMVADSRVGFTTVTKIMTADVAAGLLVTKGATGDKAKLPAAQTDYIIGATRWSPTMVQDDSGSTLYKANKGAPVFTEGPIVLFADEAIGQYDQVYAVISGAGKIGHVKKTKGADTTNLPVGRAETATAGAGLLVVYLRPAMQTVTA
ncbi:MAG: structural cement protein Gp24 [Plesiomonas sp.]